jgi:TPR repeat protein
VNKETDIRELREKADLGNASAQFLVAMAYLKGADVKKSLQEAYHYFSLAASSFTKSAFD